MLQEKYLIHIAVTKFNQFKLAMIHKFSRLAARAKMGIKGRIWRADWWDASLRLNCTIVHVTCAGAPKILCNTGFLHSLSSVF